MKNRDKKIRMVVAEFFSLRQEETKLRERCRGNADWSCCDEHEQLSGRIDWITKMAKAILPAGEYGQVLSANWWKAIGQYYIYLMLCDELGICSHLLD
jgi:hypothetical protein